jgi:hypothetical protein
MLTVVVLIVLWLVVVVPMIVRRNDERAPQRSVRGFGRSMRALSRLPAASAASDDVFVPGAAAPRRRTTEHLAVRRPVPAAQEALMYPVDQPELSAARAQMMSRRRRSLITLSAGSLIMLMLAVTVGGGLFVGGTVLFLAGLVGYVYFLRTQALRDRQRREDQQERASVRRPRSYDVTAVEEDFADAPETVVRIDDDDITLHNLDTVDLTGLYNEESSIAPAVQQRRAS